MNALLYAVTRVCSQGTVRLNLNIVMKDFLKQGYKNGTNCSNCTSNLT